MRPRSESAMHRSRRAASRWPALVCACAVAVGCSNFERKWRDLGHQPPPADPVLGRWEGRWDSVTTGHGDVLRCIVTPAEEGGYDAWFHARFMKVLSGQYHAALEVEPRHDERGAYIAIRAEADLGRLAGGVYRQAGEIRDGHYRTRYTSEHDEGTMEMKRPDESGTGEE